VKLVEEQMQVLRLRLPRKTRQTSLRMTDHYDANFRLGTLHLLHY